MAHSQAVCLPHSFLEESSLLHVQRTWAEPNGVDVVLIIPAKDVAAKQGNGAVTTSVKRVKCKD